MRGRRADGDSHRARDVTRYIAELGIDRSHDYCSCRKPSQCSPIVTNFLFSFCSFGVSFPGEQGWQIGENTDLPSMWPGFDAGRVPHVSWVYCWFSPCSEGFSSGSPVFLPPQKPTSPNSNSTRIEDQHENQLRLRGSAWKPAQTWRTSMKTSSDLEDQHENQLRLRGPAWKPAQT